jgi:hypothetical protein
VAPSPLSDSCHVISKGSVSTDGSSSRNVGVCALVVRGRAPGVRLIGPRVIRWYKSGGCLDWIVTILRLSIFYYYLTYKGLLTKPYLMRLFLS